MYYVAMYMHTAMFCYIGDYYWLLIKLQLSVPTGQHSTSIKAERQSSVPLPTGSDDATKIKLEEQSSVPYIRTASGARYAISEKAAIKNNSDKKEDQEVCVLMHLIYSTIHICTYM